MRKQGAEPGGTCRRKAPWARASRTVDAVRNKRALAASRMPGQLGKAEVATEGVCGRGTGLVFGR